VAKAKAPKKQPEPDDLVRQEAGNYLSGDERFEVRQSDATWYLVDRQQTNEFGQELMHGPFPSMKAAREAMPGARDIKPLLRSTKRPKPAAPTKELPKPEPTWIDKLPAAEAIQVRKLIHALERNGLTDAEALVRRDKQGQTPAVAAALLGQELDRTIDDLPEKEQDLARRLVARLGDVIATGERNADPRPGWALLELGPDRQPTGRRLRLGS
jgi:hypothetical protein